MHGNMYVRGSNYNLRKNQFHIILIMTSFETVSMTCFNCYIYIYIYIGTNSDCLFKPFQVIPSSRNDPVTIFSNSGQVFNCSLKKALAKFPDNATKMELQWLNESYVDLNVSNNDMYFKVRKSTHLLFSLTMFKINSLFLS